MKKQAEMVEIKGSEYKVDGVEFGTYIPAAELKDMQSTKVNEIWNKMNKSERSGCSMAMFPSRVLAYELNQEETVELMDKK